MREHPSVWYALCPVVVCGRSVCGRWSVPLWWVYLCLYHEREHPSVWVCSLSCVVGGQFLYGVVGLWCGQSVDGWCICAYTMREHPSMVCALFCGRCGWWCVMVGIGCCLHYERASVCGCALCPVVVSRW